MSVDNLYEILGIVKSCKPMNRQKDAIRIFEVVSNSSQTEYKIYCQFFCPAHRGDVLTGYCEKLQNGQFAFIQCPTVEPPSSKEAIQTAFIVALGNLRMNRRLSNSLYEFFQKETEARLKKMKGKNISIAEEPIQRNQHHSNAAVLEMISWYAFTFRREPSVADNLINVGLTLEQAEKLLKWWYQQQVIRRLYLLGLTKKEIRECCDRGWSNGSVWENSPSALYYQLLENPYLLVRLPLAKAHEIARRYKLNFTQDMLEAADLVRFVDQQTLNRGWACHPIYSLLRKYPRFFELQSTLKHNYKCEIRYNFLYLRYQAEVEDTLVNLLEPEEFTRKTHASEYTQKHLCDEQIKAVETSLNNRVTLITGAAGTGKTSLVKILDHELELRGKSYCIASFTGKAVARVKEVVGKTQHIFTLHMFLAKALDHGYDYLIIDEISMVPNKLFANVLLKLQSRLSSEDRQLNVIMLGDPNQLQPIQWGDVFNQLLESGIGGTIPTIPRVHLMKDHRRTDFDGILYQNTNQIALTDEPDEIIFEWGSDCQFITGQLPELAALLESLKGEYSYQQITIVSPYKELNDVNLLCQRIFLADNASIETTTIKNMRPTLPAGKIGPAAETPKYLQMTDSFDTTWHVGARVMMTRKNFYEINVMNGDEGIVKEVNPEMGYIRVIFNYGQDVNIPTFLPEVYNKFQNDEREEPLSTQYLSLSWAVTVHKSQGSEWDVVIFFVRAGRSTGGFFNRNLLYTGISRAKKKLFVVANAKTSFESAIYANPPKRYDNLGRRMKGEKFNGEYRDAALEETRKRITDNNL
jgi:energy-coupling factor transporter ATP-binding protein EcfA2